MEEKYNSHKIDNNNNLIDKDKELGKKMIRIQRLLFIPMISGKVIISFIFFELYLSYANDNKIDTSYMKISTYLIVFIFFYCYYLSIMTPATNTNVNKYFNYSKEKQFLKIYLWNNCQFCNSRKFVRSSHCRSCQKCILFRDHHCPYTANCIGYNNMQYFINFLFWGIYAIAFYNITCVRFFFRKNNTNLNDGSEMPKAIFICIIIDFIINFMVINGLVILIGKTLLVIYNNFTNIEMGKYPNTENHCICCNIYKGSNLFTNNNVWNIGFLSHLYYIIGPTPLHFIFPISKFQKYAIDENCPVFNECKRPDKVQILKYMIKNKLTDTNTLLNTGDANPDEFIKKCHKYYDGKTIR